MLLQIEEGMALARTAYDVSSDIGNTWGQVNSMPHLARGKLGRGAMEETLVRTSIPCFYNPPQANFPLPGLQAGERNVHATGAPLLHPDPG
jgi:hypothetical protein